MIIFPLWRFWTYTPWGFAAAILWNTCELIGVPCPWAGEVFGLIIGAKAVEVKEEETPDDE